MIGRPLSHGVLANRVYPVRAVCSEGTAPEVLCCNANRPSVLPTKAPGTDKLFLIYDGGDAVSVEFNFCSRFVYDCEDATITEVGLRAFISDGLVFGVAINGRRNEVGAFPLKIGLADGSLVNLVFQFKVEGAF